MLKAKFYVLRIRILFHFVSFADFSIINNIIRGYFEIFLVQVLVLFVGYIFYVPTFLPNVIIL